MKTPAVLLTAAALAAATFDLHAQGSLTPPPGPPAPVMKSLDQIEARTPLVAGSPGVTVDGTTGAISITAGGSYYLTGNLTITGEASGITVSSVSCTIDLNGFTISGATASGSGTAGVRIGGFVGQRVSIRNGFIIGGGPSTGFSAAILNGPGNGSAAVLVDDVHCYNVRNGIILNYTEGRSSVRNSSVESSGGEGIRADFVTNCTVRDAAAIGIFGDFITNCNVRQTGPQPDRIGISGGLTTQGRGIVVNCTSFTTGGVAIRAHSVTSSYAEAVSAVAIEATLATACVARRQNSGTAFTAGTAVGCVVTGGTSLIANKYNMP